MTERLHFHFSLSCIGEGNGNPLQRSCLENPRDLAAAAAAGPVEHNFSLEEAQRAVELLQCDKTPAGGRMGYCPTSAQKRLWPSSLTKVSEFSLARDIRGEFVLQ